MAGSTQWFQLGRCVSCGHSLESFDPIKVNVFMWRLKLNRLPSRVNLDQKGIDIGSNLCPNCLEDIKTVNHIFFNCGMAQNLWALLAKWWELDILLCANITEWYDWLDSSPIPSKDYVKNQSKPGNIGHKIGSLHQKPDQRAFFYNNQANEAICQKTESSRRSNRWHIQNIVEPEIRTIENMFSMADRTMEELLQAPTKGYGEAIVIPEILAENFEIKMNLLGAARVWYEKEPPNSIITWDDLVNKFVNQLFPPLKTTHLKNEISRFTQKFEETFGEAWDRFKEMLRACPHHEFSELTQIDTFYNGLTEQDQDLECHCGWDNVSKTDDRIDKLAYQIFNLVNIVNKQVIDPAKAFEKTCVTCGGAHAYYECIAADSNSSSVCAATRSFNQVSPPNRASHQIPPLGFAPNNPNRFNQGQGNYFNQANNFNQGNNFRGNNFQSNQGYRAQMNNAPNFQNQGFQNQPFSVPNNQIQSGIPNEIMIKSMQNHINNQPSTLGTLPSNTMPNPKGEMKAVTTRSGLAYEGPSIPTESSLEKVDEQNTEEILDKEHYNCNAPLRKEDVMS
nr:reverse transcriptase domain-containing protein [Tanacetum cinerariifolium]